jgi:site-specific recombinase XerD
MIFNEINLFLSDYCLKNQKYGFKILTDFRKYLETLGVTQIFDVQKLYITKYLREVVDKKEIRAKVKKKYAQFILRYFKFLLDNDLIQTDITVSMPKFTDYVSEKTIKNAQTRIMEKEELIKLIQHAQKVNPQIFIYLIIIVHNGMRPSECISIKLKNINFEKKQIITGVVDDFAKEGVAYYSMHEDMIPYIKKHIEWLHETYNSPEYLFHSPQSQNKFISTSSIRRDMQKYKEILKFTCKTNPHSFRHIINLDRKRRGCDDSLMAILLNQTPKGTNAQYYLEEIKKRPDLRYEFWKKFTWNLMPEILTN